MLVTGDFEACRRADSLVNSGIDGPERTSAVAGINAKMSELHAAGALAMLDRFEPALARRRGAVSLCPSPMSHSAPLVYCMSMHRLGATVVVVTHELASIFAIGTNSVYLDAGAKTMLATGDPRVLLKESANPTVRRFLTRGESGGR